MSSSAKWNVFATLNSVGLLSSRPHDRMGVAGWYTEPAGTFKDLTRGRNTWGFEVFYNIQINPWLHLTPDLQIVRSENKGENTAIIPGGRLVIDF